MPINKKQLQRLTRLAAKLKENRYPNCKTFAEELTRLDVEKNLNIACTEKTIFRYIQTLQKEFKAPIAFDRARNGYYLKHHGWTFNTLYIHSEEELLAAVLGARVAEHLFPEPLRSTIRHAVDQQLAANNPDFLDCTMVKSMVVAPAMQAPIAPEIFMIVFRAWQKHEALDIVYKDIENQLSTRRIEPHVLIFNDGVWYVKGICLLRHETRVFAIHRIVSAIASGKYFEPDEKIINETMLVQIFEKDNIKNAEILCDGYLRNLLQAKPIHAKQTITPAGEDKYLVRIPAITEFELVNWVIHQCGRATLLKPIVLRKQIRDFAEKIVKNHNHALPRHKKLTKN